jgi:glycosyltransferase involved in cell wall biosynthesis
MPCVVNAARGFQIEQMVDTAAANTSMETTGPAPRVPVIFQVVGRLDGGPASRLAIDNAIAVVKAGGRAAVASSGGPLTHELERGGVRHHLVPLDNEDDFLNFSTRRRLRKLLTQENANVVHVYSWQAAKALRPMARARQIRLIATWLEPLLPMGMFARRRVKPLSRANKVIAPSETVANHLRSQFKVSDERLQVIPPGVNTARFSPLAVRAERIIKLAQQWRLPDDRRVILVPAPLDAERGAETVIEAVRLLSRHDVFCLLLGARPETRSRREELEKLIGKKGLGGLVFIADHSGDMPAAYMLADAVVVADKVPRAYSRIVTEAQAMGRPVIAVDNGGIAEPLRSVESGRIFPVGDAAALAGVLKEILALDSDDRARLADLAIEQMRNAYALDITSEQILALYDQVLETAWADART